MSCILKDFTLPTFIKAFCYVSSVHVTACFSFFITITRKPQLEHSAFGNSSHRAHRCNFSISTKHLSDYLFSLCKSKKTFAMLQMHTGVSVLYLLVLEFFCIPFFLNCSDAQQQEEKKPSANKTKHEKTSEISHLEYKILNNKEHNLIFFGQIKKIYWKETEWLRNTNLISRAPFYSLFNRTLMSVENILPKST